MAHTDLSGRAILITGASSGIGRATALACARAGMGVVAMARRERELATLASEVAALGGVCEVFVGDVTDAGACDGAVAVCKERFGGIYSVFANAGYGVERAVHEMPDAEVRAMFETNFFGTLNIIRPALVEMRAARAGHVLICSSCVAKMALPYFSVYSATKAAQNHIGRAMNLELRSSGVFVSTVHPMTTRTEFFEQTRKLSSDGNPNHALIEHTPAALMQPPERVARAVVKCLRRPRAEVWTSVGVRLGMSICTAFPALADMGVRWMVRQREARPSGGGA